jgi:hypothetical protein
LQPDLAVAVRLLAHARVGLARFDEALQSLEQWLSLPGRPADEDRHLASVTRLQDAVRVLTGTLKVTP